MALKNAFENIAVESKQDLIKGVLDDILAYLNSLSTTSPPTSAEDVVTTLNDILTSTEALRVYIESFDFATDASLSSIDDLIVTISSVLSDINNNTDGLESLLTTINATITDLQTDFNAVDFCY